MKALRPASAISSAGLSALLLLVLSGCGNFWQNPNGTTGTGTTASTTTLAASSPSITAGSSDTLTATVTPTAATGTVNFFSSGNSIGTGSLTSGTATSSPTFATAGTYTVTAEYEGNSTYASSTSTAVTITAAAATTAISRTGDFDSASATRKTDLVLDPAGTWIMDSSAHLHNITGVVLSGGTVENIDGEGHCIFYAGKVYIATGESKSPGVYELSGGGYLAPEGTGDLGCE
jgi:hypothetical protein